MSLLDHGTSNFDALLAMRPELHDKYRDFLDVVNHNEHVPERILKLCRARIEQIHGIPVTGLADPEQSALEKGDFAAFSEPERAALKVAERIPYQHHLVSDDEVAEVRKQLGDAGCVALMTALAFCDVTCRLNLTFTGEDA